MTGSKYLAGCPVIGHRRRSVGLIIDGSVGPALVLSISRSAPFSVEVEVLAMIASMESDFADLKPGKLNNNDSSEGNVIMVRETFLGPGGFP